MPFAGFDDFEDCLLTMTEEEGHDEEAAENICGALQEEAKSDLGNVDELKAALSNARGLIADVGVDLVSAVDVPAIDSKWVMTKSGGARKGHDYRAASPLVLAKDADTEQRIAYAPAMIPRQVDKEGDVATTPRVEKAAHNFLKGDGGHDTDHSLIDGEGETVESWVLKDARTFDLPGGGEETYPAGTWMLGIEWGADAWERITAGELTGLSIYGMAEHVPLSRATSQEGYVFNRAASDGGDMGSDDPDIDTDELAASLTDPLADAVGEAVKDAFEDAKEGDLNALIDDFVERVSQLDDVDKDAAELKEDIRRAFDDSADPIAEAFGETVELDDAGVTVGFEDAAPEHVDTDAFSASVADLLKEDDEEDDEDDEEMESEASKSADDANLGKGGGARTTAAKGIDTESGGAGLPSYEAAAAEEAGE